LGLLTLYGLGVTVGAGIYVLIGVTVAEAGVFAWLSFVLAGIVVAFTAFSYAELSTRFPVSAGEAAYVDAGLGWPLLAQVVGLSVATAGVVSASAITIGASAYLGELTGLPEVLLVIGIVFSMGAVAWWGIMQSVAIAAVVTLIEIGGLIIVIGWGLGFSAPDGVPASALLPPLTGAHWGGIISASLLAFFAFIGFEDMVNVAEEVKNPRRNMPLAILLTLAIALILYVATSIATLMAVPVDDLAGSPRPLSLVFADAPIWLVNGFLGIATIATINGVLIQMIMASRVLFGMASRSQLPKPLAQISARTQTPGIATLVVTLVIAVFSLLLPIEQLAEWTSQIVLAVFVVVNVALVGLKRRPSDGDHFTVPLFVPLCGIVLSLGLLATRLL
jgi:amino acid transporter